MAEPQRVNVERVAPLPWKNGLGTTRELVAWPPDATDWLVRVSVADIDADAPFSVYPGVRRWFAVLKGAGVELRIGGALHRMTPTSGPLEFDGGDPCDCRLIDGPTRDLNLMLRNGVRGRLALVDDGLAWQPGARLAGLFAAVSGVCDTGDATTYAAAPYTLLWFDPAPTTLSFTAGARPAGAAGWWIAVTPDES